VTTGAHRKVVTVLFCDVVGSTALGESVDLEVLQGTLARYFERMKGIIESHGGMVEKFIGDAVVAVFGVPVSHEDDALRACRAAVEMRNAFPEVAVAGRIGVNTGEVLAGTEERLVTGDAVNVASRLQQVARSGQVLIGTETLALVGDAVEVGEERRLDLKGKSEPVVARPLVSIRDAPKRSHSRGFVGRETELQQLVDAWERALVEARCELVTVVGEPGVGKSRLVAEALGRIGAHSVSGHCPSYGDGVSYWPVVEVVRQLGTLPSEELAATAIRSLLRESDAVVGTDEIAWAFRKLLEEHTPLVVCFDDIHWGEETFLDLVESTALLVADAPLFIVCMARPELLDRRRDWPAILRLGPLQEEQAGELVGDAVLAELRQRIVRASGGNPLFLTEMAALNDAKGGEVEVPPTLRALLAARLDQLDEAERQVLERGAVEGELFHRGPLQALAPESELTPRLAALVRRDLVRPDRPVLPREDGYRFCHVLIRDAAYDALPKATRADLHRRLAVWLGQHGEELVELDELLGYHLEQAARYLEELGRPEPELALTAGDHLAAAGLRALRRLVDARTGEALLDRSLALTRPYRLDVHLELELTLTGWDADEQGGAERAEAAAERALAAGDELGALLARTVATSLRRDRGEATTEEVERLVAAALPRLEEKGDHRGLVHVWQAQASLAFWDGRLQEFEQAQEEAIRHARLVDANTQMLMGLPVALAFGPRPAAEALHRLDELLPERPSPATLLNRAVLLAMLDRIEEAWTLATWARERIRELASRNPAISAALHLGAIAEFSGDYELAAATYGEAVQACEEESLQADMGSYLAAQARALCALGRHEEAEPVARRASEFCGPEDLFGQVAWRDAQALVDAARSRHTEAEQLARDAVAAAERTDALGLQGDALDHLAEVLEACDKREEAVAVWREALDRYERKQILPHARHVRERLAAVQPTQA
jgi:class 3 adenylate cyclase/tetratricopeptide (TPR) repeat protein